MLFFASEKILSANTREASKNWVSFNKINDCKGDEVFSLFIVHISLDVASKVIREGGGDPLLIKVYIPLLYKFSPSDC